MIEISSLSFDELSEKIAQMGLPKFRAKQIYEWLHKKNVDSFDKMTNLDKALRQKLNEEFFIAVPTISRKLVSKIDGTVKYLFEFSDGECVESVVMKYKYGNSICVSTQVGCAMGCTFCASTKAGRVRNLTAGEILGQVYRAQTDTGERISHIVLMGIGEPLDNFDNVMKFLDMVSNEQGLNIGQRNISLSTCGVVPKIYELAKRNLQITLSISIHSPTDELRTSMMPINKKYPISELIEACRSYVKTTGRRISFEYSLIKGVNDSPECAEKLCALLRGMLCHVNLIPVNTIEQSDYRKSDKEAIERFKNIIEKHKITATVRRKLGADINAACGQLRRESKQLDR
ncbi:MAG: 23S rRNA (adenine(2503)-C(2))-methyltransferase RlmN [Oscillospiraceae bacterium]|nr:23S rRNA (adenine(2503)-C(2))-methyltransferase RlmN [Oscillospiraceae bacterium]